MENTPTMNLDPLILDDLFVLSELASRRVSFGQTVTLEYREPAVGELAYAVNPVSSEGVLFVCGLEDDDSRPFCLVRYADGRQREWHIDRCELIGAIHP